MKLVGRKNKEGVNGGRYKYVVTLLAAAPTYILYMCVFIYWNEERKKRRNVPSFHVLPLPSFI
jgi:hypothetical protein